MTDGRDIEADDQRTKLRQAQPVRHLTAQHAALDAFRADAALAGDDENEARAIGLRALQEHQQCAMRAILRHAVQIEPAMNIAAALGKVRALAAA